MVAELHHGKVGKVAEKSWCVFLAGGGWAAFYSIVQESGFQCLRSLLLQWLKCALLRQFIFVGVRFAARSPSWTLVEMGGGGGVGGGLVSQLLLPEFCDCTDATFRKAEQHKWSPAARIISAFHYVSKKSEQCDGHDGSFQLHVTTACVKCCSTSSAILRLPLAKKRDLRTLLVSCWAHTLFVWSKKSFPVSSLGFRV